MLPCFFSNPHIFLFSHSLIISCLVFISLFLCTHLSMRTHQGDVSVGGGGGRRNASAPLSFPFLSVAHVRGMVGGGGATEVHLQTQLPFKQMFACIHTHSQSGQQTANNKPSFSDVQPIGSEVDHRPLGERLGVTPPVAYTHTHTHTFVIFILASVSFHPATHFHLPLFFPSFLIN